MNIAILDLNNFSRYPTMSVGYMVAILREAGHSVRVVSPFSVGVKGYPRVVTPKPWGAHKEWLNHWAATTPSAGIRNLRSLVSSHLSPARLSKQKKTITAVQQTLNAETDILLISAYTMYYDLCGEICKLASARNIPVLVGGPYFNLPEIAARWLSIPGLSALFGGEPENDLVAIIAAIIAGEDLSSFPGLSVRGGASHRQAPPLEQLDSLPYPDYSDFAWKLYPTRIIPLMTGRGCGWGACTFCSDVVSAAGRSFRTRSADNVLGEMQFQASRYGTNIFTFLDLKLNSDLSLWHQLAEKAQIEVPGCVWTASLHANAINGQDRVCHL